MTGLPLSDFGLWLVCGLPPAPGDTNTAETGPYGNGMYTLDFSGTNGQEGFGLSDADWIAQIVQPRPVTSGNEILRYEYPNVLETINLVVTGGTAAVTNALLSKLARYTQLIADFWTGAGIEPVYLKWKAVGSPGYQYAIIRNLNYADRTSGMLGMTAGNLVVTVEREPFWRALPPGANPKEWTLEAAGLTRGESGFTYSNMSVYQHTDALIDGTISNMAEHSGLNAFYTKNWIDVPAASVPGDAPALCMITASGGYEMIVGLRSGATSVPNRAGSTVPQFFKLGGVDAATLTGDAATTMSKQNNANGLRGVASTVNAQIVRLVYTAAGTGTVLWHNDATYLRMTAAMWRGKYAVFMRGGFNGAATAVLTTYLEYGTVNNKITTAPVTPSSVYPSGTTEWGVTALGIVTVPTHANAMIAPDGRGIASASSGNYDVEFKLYMVNASGTGTYEICDLVFIPVDEGGIKIGDLSNLGSSGFVAYDNTGYYRRGSEYLVGLSGSASTVPISVPAYGQPIYLKPKTNNRLYFFMTWNNAPLAASRQSAQDAAPAVTIDIVPRWMGRRDT